MKPVDQTKLLERDGVGDCCRAAVASLLEMPLEEVPEFEHFQSGQHVAVVSFIESLGSWVPRVRRHQPQRPGEV